jgi:hypothetical protein
MAFKVMERGVHKIPTSKWEEFLELEKRYDALESQWAFPPKRRYRPMFAGPPQPHTTVYMREREWESLAAMEAAYSKAMASPEWQALQNELELMDEGLYSELFWCMP